MGGLDGSGGSRIFLRGAPQAANVSLRVSSSHTIQKEQRKAGNLLSVNREPKIT